MKHNDFYYYLNLPFTFNRAVPNFQNKGHVVLTRNDVPRLESWLNSIGLTIRHADVFAKLPGWPETRKFQDRATIHIDGYEFDNHAKLNFVYAPGNSSLVWYKLKEGCSSFEDESGAYTPSRSAWPSDCYEVARAATNRPMLVNVGQLHDIRDVDTTRICFSFQLGPVAHPERKLYWDEVHTYFKNFIDYYA